MPSATEKRWKVRHNTTWKNCRWAKGTVLTLNDLPPEQELNDGGSTRESFTEDLVYAGALEVMPERE